MKVNEAPEKIYRTTTYLDNDKGKTLWKTKPVVGAENIEYIRTDAFIEKACDYLMEYEFSDSSTITDRRKRVENFRNYMKGE